MLKAMRTSEGTAGQTGDTRSGFTIIEVLLFLGISGLLLTGLLIGQGQSVARARYTASVDNFAAFLQAQYDMVMNTQNDNQDFQCEPEPDGSKLKLVTGTESAGRTDCLVYGRYVDFNTGVYGGGAHGTTPGGRVRSAPIIGRKEDARGFTGGDIGFFNSDGSASSNFISVEPTAIPQGQTIYNLEWGATIWNPDGTTAYGALIIIRSPINGSIRTFALDSHHMMYSDVDTSLGLVGHDASGVDNFSNTTLGRGREICVKSDDAPNNMVKAIKIAANGSGPAAVSIAPLDTAGSVTCN